MKNLENYGVLEMDAREMNEVDGGLTGLEFLGAAAAVVAIGYAIDDFVAGWNSTECALCQHKK